MTFFIPKNCPPGTIEAELDQAATTLLNEFVHHAPGYPKEKLEGLTQWALQKYKIDVVPEYTLSTVTVKTDVSHLNPNSLKNFDQYVKTKILEAASALEQNDYDAAENSIAEIPGFEYRVPKKIDFLGLTISIPWSIEEQKQFITLFKQTEDDLELKTSKEIDALFSKWAPDDVKFLTHYSAQRLRELVKKQVSDEEFHSAADSWLRKILDRALGPKEPSAMMRVWLTEYSLPLKPSKMIHFEEFHKKCGWYVAEHGQDPNFAQLYFSENYLRRHPPYKQQTTVRPTPVSVKNTEKVFYYDATNHTYYYVDETVSAPWYKRMIEWFKFG